MDNSDNSIHSEKLSYTEFTLGRQIAGDGPVTVKIAENDGVTAVRSPAMCELGKRS